MKVLKFGGTSVGSAQRMQHVASLICDGRKKIVVLSAMAGTTNSLIDISDCLFNKDVVNASDIIAQLKKQYEIHVNSLYGTEEYKRKAWDWLNGCFERIESFLVGPFSIFEEKVVVAQGELMSTGMMYYYLQEQGVPAVLLPALDFMRITKDVTPDSDYIKTKLQALLQEHPDTDLFITQGFICKNAFGEIDNLKRGGSDYTASIIGAAVDAEEIQIWTDIDGLHNNDPRYVSNTTPVRQLNFDEAAKLAHFGAKILHPSCIMPARENNIPVRLLNTFDPQAPGTLISNSAEKGCIKAVAAKDNITYVKIKSLNVVPIHQFLSVVFNTFSQYKTAIDMVTASETGVSVTIDDNSCLDEIVVALQKYATVSVDTDMVIICVVGDLEWQNVGFEAKIVQALKDIPVRMISYGGSSSNVSLVMKAEDKAAALEALNANLFLAGCGNNK